MPKVVSKGNDKYCSDCNGRFSELTCCCVYYSKMIFFVLKRDSISSMAVNVPHVKNTGKIELI